ncbi:MAG: radical SAM protein [Bellilinea sp.]
MRLRLRGLRLCLCWRWTLAETSMTITATGWMERIFTVFRKSNPSFPPSPGLYTYHHIEEGGKARLHLRIESDQSGTLLINASRIYHFNPTAAGMAYLTLNHTPVDRAVDHITRAFRVSRAQAVADYTAFTHQMDLLVSPDAGCPVCELEVDTIPPFSRQPTRPYRMDLALTYRCNHQCSHCYNARSRSFPELNTRYWLQVLDKLWEIGIPHIVFTGGEPTLRNDLPELIAHAEKNGQITGINTNGTRLKDPAYAQSLVDAGLDHVQITLESHLPEIHDRMVVHPGAWQSTIAGLQNALSTRLYVMTNTTLLMDNAPYLSETLDYLAHLGVPTIGLNALIYSGRGLNVNTGIPEKDLPALLNIARAKTERNGQRLIWYTPTEYCNFDPVQMELGVKGCTAALYNMCIEPDGSVLPCQSYYTSLGNILDQPWASIWNHDLAIALRERHNLPEKCHDCALVAECGGGCPLARQITGSPANT